MPTYEYSCESNGRVVEVSHKMAETVKNLCKRADIPVGKTDPKAKVTKLMSASFVSAGGARTSIENCDLPGCGTGACSGGLCDPQ